jgi:glycosyltransferase involved in cell wall biosynthesis
MISKKYKIPLVVSDQGGLTTHPFLKQSSFVLKLIYKVQNLLIKQILKQSSAVSSANEYENNIFLDLYSKSNIKIIRNGVNLKSLVSNNDFKKTYKINSKFVLFVGRFSKSKGIENLINAINLIKNELRSRNTILVIMGVDFGYEDEMFSLIKKFDLSEHILVIKNPPREDVISAYGKSEFLVMPSQWELSPLVPLESFAFSRPVISTNSHGIPFTVQNNKNGILVEPENPAELSNAIIKLLDNSTQRDSLGSAGYDFVQKECNCISMAKNHLELYQNVLDNIQNK